MKRKTKWPLEKLHFEALKYNTRGDFAKYSPGAYQAARATHVLNLICIHMEIKHYSWPLEEVRKEALKHNTRGDFQKYSPNAYQIALKRGILDQICRHMEIARRDWTNEELALKALKYNSRSEFEKNNHKAYDVAMKRGILDQICNHMVYLARQWTNKELHEEAFKYKTRSELKYANASAYAIAIKRGILDSICSHMKRSVGTSIEEKELFNIVKNIFSSAKKIRDTKVKIEGKPYIKGFDIDILVPELGLGIEFDGPYHHSYDFMRNDPKKHKWSDEDIRNYHEIKDAWFASRGITILHIKGDDWKQDKQACINRCLTFLGINLEKVA